MWLYKTHRTSLEQPGVSLSPSPSCWAKCEAALDRRKTEQLETLKDN